ncbi:MAG: Holliday junction branch migration protein RuvA [Bdellovibrionia bacterium]
MIGYLRGKIIELSSESVIVDVSGVGYEVFCSAHTIEDLQTLLGNDIIVWIHTHVREDALTLFGFHSKAEKSLFLSLLKVNGIGPKMALTMLSGARPDQLHKMIEAGDAKALSQLPKVGKKTAEQIILTLKGKLVSVDSEQKVRSETHTQVTSALLNLGFKAQLVDQFVATLPKEIQLEEGVRQGLQALTGRSGI